MSINQAIRAHPRRFFIGSAVVAAAFFASTACGSDGKQPPVNAAVNFTLNHASPSWRGDPQTPQQVESQTIYLPSAGGSVAVHLEVEHACWNNVHFNLTTKQVSGTHSPTDLGGDKTLGGWASTDGCHGNMVVQLVPGTYGAVFDGHELATLTVKAMPSG